MDGMITMMIAPVMMKDNPNKQDKKAKTSLAKTKAKREEKQPSFEEEFAATYQHDPYADLGGITYKKPVVRR